MHSQDAASSWVKNAARSPIWASVAKQVFDISGAPMIRFGPSEARSNQNYAHNTVRSDLVGPHTMQTKFFHFPVSSQSPHRPQFGPF